jgi:thioredoxin-related protein
MFSIHKGFTHTLVLAATCAVAWAQGPANAPNPSANDLLGKAVAQAAKDHKFVFVEFHASWCIWCKRLNLALTDPAVAPYMTANFVPLQIDVLEHDPARKGEETPGGLEWMEKLGNQQDGKSGGIPFFAVIDDKGNTVLTSTLNGKASGNMGYPSEPKEFDRLFAMLQAGGGKLSADDQRGIIALFKKDVDVKFVGDKPVLLPAAPVAMPAVTPAPSKP